MQIPNINRYLLSIYVESVLKIFKHFKSMRVWRLIVGFWCFNISLLLKLILGNFRANRYSKSFNQNFHIFFEEYLKLNSRGVPFSYNLVPSA